jgi:hypothetical protein
MTMKCGAGRLVLAAVVLTSACVAWAAPASLPPLTLADPSGAAATEATLLQAAAWTMIVVDAEKPLTASVLSRLQKKEGDWGGKLVVVTWGSQGALDRLVLRNAKLAGAKWYRDTSGQILKQLQLAGTPVLLGIRADNSIAWQVSSIPEQPEKAQAMASSWIANTTQVR